MPSTCGACAGPVNPMFPHLIPGLPVKIEFCSSACSAVAEEHFRHRTKLAREGGKVKTPAPEFGGADVVRHTCDHCGRSIVLCWKSRDGEYCSNKCMRSAEAAKNPPPDETQEQEENEMKSASAAPASKPAAKSSKPAPKASPKPTAAKKAAAPAADAKPRRNFASASVITVINKDHKYKGLTAERFKVVKNGMTVEDFAAASKEKVDAGRSGPAYINAFLTKAIEAGHITVSKAAATPAKAEEAAAS